MLVVVGAPSSLLPALAAAHRRNAPRPPCLPPVPHRSNKGYSLVRGRCERPSQPYQPARPRKVDCLTLDKRCVLCDRRNLVWCAKCAAGYTKNKKDGRCERVVKKPGGKGGKGGKRGKRG